MKYPFKTKAAHRHNAIAKVRRRHYSFIIGGWLVGAVIAATAVVNATFRLEIGVIAVAIVITEIVISTFKSDLEMLFEESVQDSRGSRNEQNRSDGDHDGTNNADTLILFFEHNVSPFRSWRSLHGFIN